MKRKKRRGTGRVIVHIIVCCLMAELSVADNYRFAGLLQSNSEDWFNPKSWQNQTTGQDGWSIPGGIPLPNADDVVRFNYGGASGILAGDAGTIEKLQIGLDDQGGKLTLTNGAKLIVLSDFNLVGYEAPGTLIVDGGSLYYGGDLNVGGEQDGMLTLNNGLVRVDSEFHHNMFNNGGMSHSIIAGGMLDVNLMSLESGVLDISGGIVRIRSTTKSQIKRWISEGRITFYGAAGCLENIHYTLVPWGDEGYEIKAVSNVRTVG